MVPFLHDFKGEMYGYICREFSRVQEASLLWSLLVNILDARADSGFYRVLLKLLGMCVAPGCQGYSVLLA